jgi:hypothetical protein
MKLLNRFINFSSTLGVLLCSVLICFNVLAQTGTAIIRGTVTDPQGKAVAGATVKLVSEDKNFTRTQTTNGYRSPTGRISGGN